jgi:hypothetical protein
MATSTGTVSSGWSTTTGGSSLRSVHRELSEAPDELDGVPVDGEAFPLLEQAPVQLLDLLREVLGR